MALTPTNKSNPCQICKNTSGSCRQGKEEPDYWQCMTYADAKKGEIVGGYKCIGATKNKQWGQFKPDNSTDFTEEKRREWQLENQLRRQRQTREEEESAKRALPIEARDEAIRRLHKHFGLSARHREDLKNRGLSDEAIESLLYFTINPNEVVPQGIPANLPGIKHGQIKAAGNGYACVSFFQGRATGWQTRLDDTTDNKYRWAKGEYSSHLANGELPITIVKPVDEVIRRRSIGICEGINKPAIAANRLGQVFIGASSANFASSPEQTRKHLLAASELLDGTKHIEFAADAGAVSNPNVIKAYRRSWELFIKLGYEVRVSWWGQLEKDSPDIDELTQEQLSSIQLLTIDQFTAQRIEAAIVQEDKDTAEKATAGIKGFVSFGEPEKVATIKKEKPAWVEKARGVWRKRRQFKAQHTIKKKDGWFEWQLPTPQTIFHGRSGLGTGKTTQLRKWVTAANDESWLFLGYRNTLLLQLCADKPGQTPLGIYHLHEHDGKAHISNPESKLACCVDSLIHFQPEDFDDKNIVLDEVMSVIRHLQTSSTISFPDKVQYLFSEAIRRAKRVICLDGLLADWAVEYLKKIAPDKEVITVRNLDSRVKAPINLLMGTATAVDEKIKPNDRSPWLKIILEESRFPAICSDSQVFCEAMDELLSTQGYKVLRVDSKTVSEAYVKEFLRDCDAYILANKPDCVIYSPSAESGVDISIKNYFTHHFGFFFGVLGIDSILQMLGRVRDTIPKYIWCREWSAKEAIESSSPYDKVIKEAKHSNLLMDLIDTIKESPNTEEALIRLKELVNENVDEHFEVASRIKAIANFERSNLRECLLEALETAGYKVQQCLEQSDAESKGKVKEQTKAVKIQTCKEIFEAEQIPLDKIDETGKRFDASWSERVKAIQAGYRKRLPGIEQTPNWTEEFIYKIRYGDRDFISHAELYWLLKHPDVALRMQQESWSKRLEYPSEQISLSRLRSRRAVVEALRSVGIEKFLEPGKEWRQDCPEFKEAAKKGKDPKITNILGKHPGKAAPAQYIASLLKMVGLEWSTSQKRGGDGINRHYILKDKVVSDVDRITALQCLNVKWHKYLEGETEQLYWEIKQDEEYQAKTGTLELTLDQPKNPLINEPEKKRLEPLAEKALRVSHPHPNSYKKNSQGCDTFKSQNECDSCDLEDLEAKYLYSPVEELEKARDEDNSSNLVTKSDLGRLYKIRSFEGSFGAVATTLSMTWLPNCRLVQLPSQFRDYYIFETPDGSRIPVADDEGFEPMEDEPVAPSLGQQVAEVFKDGIDAVRGLLRGLGDDIERFSAMEAFEAAFPGQLAELMAIAPDCWQWCWE